jgi:hypothetical protein
MELKRKYRTARSKNGKDLVKKNRLLRRNFSLTGLCHIFSNYGESIWRPTAIGVITVGLH